MDDKPVITLKFAGDHHEIDIRTYADVLTNYDSIIKCVAKESKFTEPIVVSVKASSEGSFEALLTIGTQFVD